jgi:hypothetical protein
MQSGGKGAVRIKRTSTKTNDRPSTMPSSKIRFVNNFG